MRNLASRLSGLALLFAAQGAFAYDYNCDLTNAGTSAAYDLAVVLNGSEQVTATFNGYGTNNPPLAGLFSEVDFIPTTSGDTIIHWKNLWGNDSPIPVGKTIHVGWSTLDCKSTVKDMYWTDKDHNRIRNSVVKNVTWGITYRQWRFPVLTLGNQLAAKVEVAVRNIRFAVVPRALPLAALSTSNPELMQSLRPVSDAPVVLAPGQQVNLNIPVAVEPGQAVVAVYDIADVSAARAVNFVQVLNDGRNCGSQF